MKLTAIIAATITASLSYLSEGADIYVATTGNDASEDPSSELTPLKTVSLAVSKSKPGDIIHIASGTYAWNYNYEKKQLGLTEALNLNEGRKMLGEGDGLTVLKGYKVSVDGGEVSDLRVTGWGGGGAVEFVKNGAGGTVRRCDISGNTRTSTTGTGVLMFCGNLIDCTVTNNVNSSGGNGVGVWIGPTSDCLVEGCLIADNDTGNNGGVGGLYITNENTFNGFNVTIRHCTIVRNCGGDAGGLSLNGNVNISLENCIVSDNMKTKDATASNTEDAYLGWSSGYARVLKSCIIARCPTHNAGYDTTGSLLNVAAGLWQPYEGDYSVDRQSAAWGNATNGMDIGWFQTEHGESFAVGCYAVTNRAIGSLTTTLVGTAIHASGDVSYEWDMDGDGSFEKSGAIVEATFDTVGWQSVRVRATCGGDVDEATVERVACVFPVTTYCWSQSPSPAFPYATWETASHLPHPALAAVVDGGKLQFTNEAFAIAKPLCVRRRMELCGTGKDNNSVLGSVAGFSVSKFTDVNAKGTSIQRTSSDVVNLKLYNTGSLAHSIAFGPGRSTVVQIYGESTLSNCVVRYGEYTGGNGNGVWANAGLITHCVISNNYNYNNNCFGGEVYLEGTAKLRNSLVTGGKHTNTTSPGCQGSVYAKGYAEVVNCTIVGNQAGVGAGLYTDGANVKIYNNIIRDNITTCDSSDHVDWYDKTGTGDYRNNCMAVAHGEGDGTVTASPGFILDDLGRNTWTFGAASKCVNAGTPVAWATEDATDLFGNKRVQGEAIDIGCFEADLSKAMCDIEVSASEIVGGAADVTFSVKLVGATLPDDAVCKWDFDGDGVYEREGASVTLRCEEGYHTAALKVTRGDETLYEAVGKSDLVTVYPTVIYFDTANAEGEAFPYNTPKKAAAKMSDVLAAAKSGVDIRVCEGIHNVDAQILLNIKCTLRAAEGVTTRPRIVRKFDGNSFVSVGHAETVVEGLDIDDDLRYSVNVNVNDGMVRDCIIRNGSYTSGVGIGLTMNGGLVDRCEIVGNRAQGCDAEGAIVWMSGDAVLRNSLVRGNYLWANVDAGRRGGFVMAKGQAVIENCTVTGNTNMNYGVVTTLNGGTVRNCVVFGNECGSDNKIESPYFPSYAPLKTGTNNTLLLDDGKKTADFDYNCYTSVTATAYGEHDIVADPKFSAKRGNSYYLSGGSPCLDSAMKCEWMNDNAFDIIGNPRVRCGKPDMGCYECPAPGLMLRVR